MRNKKSIVLIVILVLAIIGAGVFFYFRYNNSNNSNYEASKTSTNSNQNTNENSNQTENSENSGANTNVVEEKPKQPVETQISTFSTKIYTKDSARQNNLQITCSTLNNTTVKAGDTFSFCDTVGQATSSKGYEKADIFDRNGNKIQGYGGGNCQVSTTLYNAVLAVPSLVVTERHEHSNDVPYIQEGKDAAVAYGSYDLKFRNDSGNDIKILASTNSDSITITINSITYQ